KMEIRAYIPLLALGIVYAITAAGAQAVDKSAKKRIHDAVKVKNDTLVKQIIDEQNSYAKTLLDSMMSGDTLFSIAIKTGDISMVQLLVDLGADFQKIQFLYGNNVTPLKFAKEYKKRPKCKDVSQPGEKHSSCHENVEDIISYLTEQEAKTAAETGSSANNSSKAIPGGSVVSVGIFYTILSITIVLFIAVVVLAILLINLRKRFMALQSQITARRLSQHHYEEVNEEHCNKPAVGPSSQHAYEENNTPTSAYYMEPRSFSGPRN
ncbi:unnamed protein product, partial [Meganyctiphanes norvegica]